MGRVEVVALAEERAVIGRVPVLRGIDAGERQLEQPIDSRDNRQSVRDRQLIRAEFGEAALGIDHEQRSRSRRKSGHGGSVDKNAPGDQTTRILPA